MEIYKEEYNYKTCVKLDNLLLHYVNEHKCGNLSSDDYFKKCVNTIEHTWTKQEDI